MPLANKPHRGKCRSVTAPTSIQPSPSRQPCTRYVALHPLRSDASDQKGCNAYRSGAPPPTTSTTAGNSSRHTPTSPASDAASQPRNAHLGPEQQALHPLRRDTPVTSRYTRYVAMHPIRRGAMPTGRVHRLSLQAQPRAIPPHRPEPSVSDAATRPRNARQCSSAAIKETTRDRETRAGDKATDSGTHKLLGHSIA